MVFFLLFPVLVRREFSRESPNAAFLFGKTLKVHPSNSSPTSPKKNPFQTKHNQTSICKTKQNKTNENRTNYCAELDNSDKDYDKDSHSNTGGSTGLSMTGDRALAQSGSNSNSNQNNNMFPTSASSSANNTISGSNYAGGVSNIGEGSGSGGMMVTITGTDGTTSDPVGSMAGGSSSSSSAGGTMHQGSASTLSVPSTPNRPISRPSSIVVRNFKDEPR